MEEDDAIKTLALIQRAREHAAQGQHGPATAMLMKALRDVPQLAEELDADLTFSLKVYGEHLATLGQPKNALWLYSQAIPLLQRPTGLLTNLGALEYSLGRATASIVSFQQALTLDPCYWPALESLENVKSLAVDRWHYRMLNHAARNEAYWRAIRRAVDATTSERVRHGIGNVGVTVLDIGTGTGILAVMAARAGASKVFACEVNSVLCDVAKQVVERNGVADRVTIINKSSGALQLGVDVPNGGVDIIVTELVDSGLLGERIVPVLTDARARGLLAKGGRVIPEGACVYASIIESETVRRRSRLLGGCAAGLNATAVRPTVEEPYTCEDLDRLDHRVLTGPAAVLEVDFLRDGAGLITPSPRGTWNVVHAPHPPLRLPVRQTGHADAIAVWFDLWLDKERGDLDVVSTRPERQYQGDASGWDAGIYFASGTRLQEGREVALTAYAGRDRLHLTLSGSEGAAPAFGSAERQDDGSGTGDYNDCRSSCARSDSSPCFIGEMDMARLNDEPFHRAHGRAAMEALIARGVNVRLPQSPSGQQMRNTAARKLGEPQVDIKHGLSAASGNPPPHPPALVLDLCGAWGLAGMLVAKAEVEDGSLATRVLAVAESSKAASALNTLARANGISCDRYVATADRLVDVLSRSPRAVADESAGKVTASVSTGEGNGHTREAAWFMPGSDERLAWCIVMASSLVEGSGLLRQGGVGDLELCQRFMDVNKGGCGFGGGDAKASFVPGRLRVVCQGLQRPSLLSENRVHLDRCCGIDVTPVNAFGVNVFRELDLSATVPCHAFTSKRDGDDYEASPGRAASAGALARHRGEVEAFLTAPIECYELDLSNVRAGPDGCLPRRKTRMSVLRGGTLHAIAFWFRQQLGGAEPAGDARAGIDTGPSAGIGIARGSSHFRQAAALLENPIEVRVGQSIEISVFCHNSAGVVVHVLGVDAHTARAVNEG